MGNQSKDHKQRKILLAAFAGESQGKKSYTYFASAARKEGYEQIANLFLETAENERSMPRSFSNILRG